MTCRSEQKRPDSWSAESVVLLHTFSPKDSHARAQQSSEISIQPLIALSKTTLHMMLLGSVNSLETFVRPPEYLDVDATLDPLLWASQQEIQLRQSFEPWKRAPEA